jgi:hypothetical protein
MDVGIEADDGHRRERADSRKLLVSCMATTEALAIGYPNAPVLMDGSAAERRARSRATSTAAPLTHS